MSTAASSTNAWAKTRELYRSLAMPSRMLLIALAVVLVAGAGYWGIQVRHEDWVYLLGGQEFNESQVQAFSQAFQAEGLTDFRADGPRLRVPRSHVAQYAAALAKHQALPASFYSAFDKAAEQTSWWSSSVQDDRRWELARQKSLAQIIEQMPEVESASVIIDRSTSKGLRPVSDIRATVSVKPRGGRELPPLRIRQIRNVVKGSVANMPVENVTVIDLNGRSTPDAGTDTPGSDDLLVRMKEFEEHYTRKIQGVLAFVPEVLVTVNVELDTTRQRHTEQVVWPATDESANLQPRILDADATATVTANLAVELPSHPEPESQHEVRPSQQQTWEEHVPFAPKSVTVAIAVPQDIASALAQTHPGPDTNTPSWSAHIQALVATSIPAGVTPRITVESYPRGIDRAAATAATGPLTPDQSGTSWGIATCSLVTLAVVLGWGGLRWHLTRLDNGTPATLHREYASQEPRSNPDRTGGSGEYSRELVRVERSAARGRGPHLGQAPISSFEDLRRLAPASLQAMLAAVESRLWAPALRGASRELCERILTHLPARAAMLLRDEVEYPGPVRLGDVESAQQEILEVVRRLDHTGDLVLEDQEEVVRE